MTEALTIVWFAAAVSGALARFVGLVSDGVPRPTLMLIGKPVVAGVLGIFADGPVTTASD